MSSNQTSPAEVRPYRYFVAYMTPDPLGFGNVTLQLTGRIDNSEVLEGIKRHLEEVTGNSNVIILNFQLLCALTATAGSTAAHRPARPAQV